MSTSILHYRDTHINLYPAKRSTVTGDFYGYINERGQFIIPPKFNIAYDFDYNEVAIIGENNLYGVINIRGEYVVEPIYLDIRPYKEERAIYLNNQGMGVVDNKGNIITKKVYSYIGDFSEGLAVVEIQDEISGNYIYGYIDKEGIEIIIPQYFSASDFKEGVAIVKNSIGAYSLIDKEGNIINSYSYGYVGEYNNKIMVFSESGVEPYGYIDINGNIIIKPSFGNAQEFKDGVAVVSTLIPMILEGIETTDKSTDYFGNYGLINLQGEYVYDPIYNEINNIGQNKVSLGKLRDRFNINSDNVYAIGDIWGKILTAFKFLDVKKYEGEIASVHDDKVTYFIDKYAEVVKTLPIVKGTGYMKIKNNIVYADIDYIQYYMTRSGKIIYKPNDEVNLNNKYSVRKLKYKPNVDYLVYYPKIIESKNKKVQNSINSKLEDLSLLKDIEEDTILDYRYLGDYSIKFFKKQLLVLDMIGYNYPKGAAHGLTYKTTPNIDLKTGTFYKLSDLFKSDTYWARELYRIINNQIDTNPLYFNVYKNNFYGNKAFLDIERNFYVDEENLYIYFQQYEIAPYSEGIVTFKIPFNEIDELINKRGDFYRAFNTEVDL